MRSDQIVDSEVEGGDRSRAPMLKITDMPAILWRRLWVIALAIVLALASGIIYLRQATPIYRATNKLFVTQLGRNQLLGESPEVSPLTQSRNYRGTQLEILDSPLVLKRLKLR